MTTLDATDRELCTVRRQSTNTPLQALVLMNDDTWVEAARSLATRCLVDTVGDDSTTTDAQRLTRAFRLLLARQPASQELAVLQQTLAHYRQRFATAPGDAAKLIATGESPVDSSLDQTELAAFTAVCSLLINLDETITRE